eukprot:12915413-Prorocentrum_lima.AAC.1
MVCPSCGAGNLCMICKDTPTQHRCVEYEKHAARVRQEHARINTMKLINEKMGREAQYLRDEAQAVKGWAAEQE